MSRCKYLDLIVFYLDGPDRASVSETAQPTLVVTAGSVSVTRRPAGPRFTAAVSGTARPSSWEMTTSTGSPSRLLSQGNVFARRETATSKKFVLINEITQPVPIFTIRTCLITTVSSARKSDEKIFCSSETCLSARARDHRHCFTKDINMVCSQNTRMDPVAGVERNLCQCRKDMEFDSK